MYLSYVTPKNGPMGIDIQDVDMHHNDVWTLFPGRKRDQRDFVFKASKEGYLITSNGMPMDPTGLWNVDSKDFSHIAEIPIGSRLKAVVSINPTRRVRKPNGKKTDVEIVQDYINQHQGIPISEWDTPEQIFQAWFTENEERWGFTIESFSVSKKRIIRMDKYQIVSYELSMVIVIVDSGKFVQTVLKGIGDRNDRGFGMLMLKRA
jgi:CRISPR-associated protein Cas6/Cse3/CasE subtype I-E